MPRLDGENMSGRNRKKGTERISKTITTSMKQLQLKNGILGEDLVQNIKRG